MSHERAPLYFSRYSSIRFEREPDGILVMSLHSDGGPLKFTAKEHESFVDAFYEVSRDRGNKVVVLTGAEGHWMPDIDFSTFGDVSDPDVWSKIHDEGTQILENIINIRVPVIWALEGKAHVHAEYGLLANLVVAGASATFHDLPHFAGGIVPGDGAFTIWSYFIGPGRAQALLLDPKIMTAQTGKELGIVAEIVPDGGALERAKEIARGYLKKTEVTRRNTRIHFMQPIKERIVRDVGYGFALEGGSAAALVKSMRTR